MYAAEEDPYCYPGTTVLRNVFDIRDAVVLEQLELELTIARADEPLPHGALDRAHYCAIHRHFFQDIYPWAGQVRTVRISKGSSHFCYPEYIEAQLQAFDCANPFKPCASDGLGTRLFTFIAHSVNSNSNTKLLPEHA